MPVVVLLALFAAQTEADGCMSCHTGTATTAAHAALLPKHAKVTCVGCHRGAGTARDKVTGHSSGPDELLFRERVGAACVACHIAGSVRGTEAIVAGGKSYLARGCGFCHSGAFGLGYLGAFAPPLFAIGGRGSNYLTEMIRNPKKTFPATVMPAFHLPPAEEKVLLAYLLSLRGDYVPPKRPELSKQRCGTCHVTGKKAEGLAAHQCGWITEERDTLKCARCHAKGIPASTKECLYIEQRRKECGRCHEGGIDGR